MTRQEFLINLVAFFVTCLLITLAIHFIRYLAKEEQKGIVIEDDRTIPKTDYYRQYEMAEDYINFKYGIEENPEENPFYWFEVKENLP